MKKIFLLLIITIFSGIYYTTNAQGYHIPETVVTISKQQANIRQSPTTSATVVEKVSDGTLYELISKKGDWYEAKDIRSQETVYISTSVSNLMDGRLLHRTDKGLVEKNDGTKYVYQKITTQKGQESIASYAFYQKDEKDIVYATLSQTVNSISGSSFTNELYYKGKQMGWYLIFDEQVDWEGSLIEKVNKPIIVFSKSPKGVIVNGEFYKKTSNEF